MKRFSLLILLASTVFVTWGALAQSSAGQKVYVMPMAAGFDQHLAGWLAREHVMQVVTDARVADVVLTDRLGDAFEQKMVALKPEAKPVESKDDNGKKDGKLGVGGETGGSRLAFRSASAKGTLFLVDVKSRAVLWSGYQRRRAASDDQMNREAEAAVKELHGALGK